MTTDRSGRAASPAPSVQRPPLVTARRPRSRAPGCPLARLSTVVTVLVVVIGAFGIVGCAGAVAVPELAAPGLGPADDGARAGSFRVLLPPDYPAGAPYPALYFLHDFLGSSGVLWKHGVAQELERRMAAGEMPSVVLVAPEGDQGYWSDFHDGSRRYETWVTGPLREQIESTYQVVRSRDGRAVAGISMGGYGAVKAALRRPELYAEAASLSGALIPWTWQGVEDSPFYLRWALKRVFGDASDDNSLADNDIVTLLEAAAARVPAGDRPRLILRSGSDDKYDLDRAAERFHARAVEVDWPAELELESGGHDWDYWSTSAVDLLTDQARRLADSADEETEP